MEEAEAEQQALDDVGLRGVFDLLPVKGFVGTEHILLETTWWLEGHLDGVLKD